MKTINTLFSLRFTCTWYLLACIQTRVKCANVARYSPAVAYLDVIERCESIFVQLYNIKSIPSAASENHRGVKRKIRREGEIERKGRGEKRSDASLSHCIRTTVYENVMLRETINIMYRHGRYELSGLSIFKTHIHLASLSNTRNLKDSCGPSASFQKNDSCFMELYSY